MQNGFLETAVSLVTVQIITYYSLVRNHIVVTNFYQVL